ncbi:MAG TPA: response regulator transcription factor [Campylobacterales bacterium]|nr:response regulator transcription factor [Campylobacterales bacterium]
MIERNQTNRAIEIIIIEDEEDILELIEYHLLKAGYSVTGFLSTENVKQFLEEESPALMIVDRNLPDVEGSEFVAQLREEGENIPVIFLTAKNKPDDIEEGFTRGADDYITKPFNNKELLLRVKAILRRSGIQANNKVKYRDILINIQKQEVYIEKQLIELTPLEFNLLYTLIKHQNQTLERIFLLDEVWQDEGEKINEKTVNVAIRRLKKKIDPNETKEYIASVWGVGYRLR